VEKMSEPKGYYALISSPTKVRFWDGFTWQGEAVDDAKIDIVGFVDSLEEIPIQIVEDESSDFQAAKYCSACGRGVIEGTKVCPSCGSHNFSVEKLEIPDPQKQEPDHIDDLKVSAAQPALTSKQNLSYEELSGLLAGSTDNQSSVVQVALPEAYLNVISHFLKGLWYLIISSVIAAIATQLVNNAHQDYLRCTVNGNVFDVCSDASFVILLLFSPAAITFFVFAMLSGSAAVSKLNKLQK